MNNTKHKDITTSVLMAFFAWVVAILALVAFSWVVGYFSKVLLDFL